MNCVVQLWYVKKKNFVFHCTAVKNKGSSTTHIHMDEPQKYTGQKRQVTEKMYTEWFHLSNVQNMQN